MAKALYFVESIYSLPYGEGSVVSLFSADAEGEDRAVVLSRSPQQLGMENHRGDKRKDGMCILTKRIDSRLRLWESLSLCEKTVPGILQCEGTADCKDNKSGKRGGCHTALSPGGRRSCGIVPRQRGTR